MPVLILDMGDLEIYEEALNRLKDDYKPLDPKYREITFRLGLIRAKKRKLLDDMEEGRL